MGALGVLLVLTLFTAPVSLLGRVYFAQEISISDLVEQNYPMRGVLSDSLAQGRLPFWSTLIFGGFPILAESQIGALFPPNWIGPWDNPGRSLSLTLVLVLFMAGLSTYRLALAVGLSPLAAFVSGATWPLSGQFVSNTIHPNFLAAVCLAPLALAMAEESCRRGDSRRILGMAPVLAFSFFAGYPQMVYLTVMAILLSLASRWLPAWDPRRRPGLKTLVWLLVVGSLAGALAFPQLRATLEFKANSARAGGLEFNAAGLGSVKPSWLARWIYPWIQGDVSRLGTPFPEDGFFIWTHAGILSAIALGLALLRIKQQPWLFRPILLLGCSLLVAFGRHTPVFEWLRVLPGFNSFRFPCRALFFSELLLSLLLGWLVQAGARSRKWKIRGITYLAIVAHLAGLILIAFPVLPTIPSEGYPPANPVADFLLRSPPGRHYSLFSQEAWIDAYVRAGGWREDLTPYVYFLSLLRPDVNLAYGLASSQGCTGLYHEGNEFLSTMFGRTSPDLTHPPTRVDDSMLAWLRVMGVRYVTTVRPLIHPGLNEIFKTSFPWKGFQVRVYELSKPGMRVRVVGSAVPGQGLVKEIMWLGRPGEDPSQATIIRGLKQAKGTPGPAGTARIEHEGPEHLLVSVDARRPGYLVVADTAYPGWHAYLDGQEVEIRTADLVYRAVEVPAGHHQVLMAYRMHGWSMSVVVMALGVCLWGALVFRGSKDRS